MPPSINNEIAPHIYAVQRDCDITSPRDAPLMQSNLATHPIPGFGNPASAIAVTLGLNPSGAEFKVGRSWPAHLTHTELAVRSFVLLQFEHVQGCYLRLRKGIFLSLMPAMKLQRRVLITAASLAAALWTVFPAAGAGAAERTDSGMTTVPVMKWADTNRLGRPFAKDPSVIRFGGRYLMYFSLPPFARDRAPANAPRGWSIGIAESRDLRSWTKAGELHPEQACETNGLCAPGARVLDGQVHLFYQTYGNGARDAICHAVSPDGLSFQRDPSNPVFHPTGDWNSGRAIDAEVFPVGDRLLLYFATRDPAGKVQMLGVAGAALKSDFSRGTWRQLSSAPILRPELAWEKNCIEAPALLQRGGTLYLFYAGGYNNDPQQVGVATSKDGLQWTRLSPEPLLAHGRAGEWNSSESGHPGVLAEDDGRTWLFFQGNPDQGRTWWLAAVELGWTGGRPVLRAPARTN